MCASNVISSVWTLFYSNMTVSLCIRQESKRNDDSVSVEELDWSAESSWTPLFRLYNSSPNTNDLYIHYMDKSTDTPSLEEKKTLPNCGNKDGNIIHVLKLYLHQFWSVWSDGTHMYKSLVFVDEFVAHLKSHQRCSAAFCRPVKFFHTDWIIISLWFLSYTQRHCHVRIEKSSVQTVDIQLDSLEYH